MNWFKYRLPNSDTETGPNNNPVFCGASHSLISGLAEGFVVAPFFHPESGIITIPSDFTPHADDISPIESRIPSSTGYQEYCDEIEAIQKDLDGKRGKTVAARAISLDFRIDINKTFESLCDSYPDAFVFAFSSSATGTWIGASPELLLRKDGEFLSTMALAGTRTSSKEVEAKEWDKKNLDEQAMVTEFIVATLMKHCSAVTVGQTFTKKAGPVEHICTPISAYMPPTLLADDSEESHLNRLRRLLTDLSPTPAVCGSDRKRSIDIILRCESFQREMYGGFCGPNDIEGVTAFFVNLRSAKVSPDSAAIFAGGGITSLSSHEKEWMETEMKSKTIINQLITSEE